MLWLVSLVVSSTVGHAPALAPMTTSPAVPTAAIVSAQLLLKTPARQIRSPQPRIAQLLAHGVQRSKTFAELVARIHRTDLIVYVEATHDLPSATVGRILLQTVAGGRRYVRVQIRSMLPRDQAITVIAHELRHALEIAEDGKVMDDVAVTELYRRIGHVSDGGKGFDTDAARSTGLVVWNELVG